MKIKQIGNGHINKNEICNIIKLMKFYEQNFKHNTVTQITIWNSKLLWILYSIVTLHIFSLNAKEILQNLTKGEYDTDSRKIDIFLFTIENKHKNLDNDLNKSDKQRNELLKLEIIYNLLHEFRHNYQSIFYKEQYQNDTNNYNAIAWCDKWIEQDACHFAKQFMEDNYHQINSLLNIEYSWNVHMDTDIKKAS